MVIRLGLTELKKTRVVYLLDLFEERGENGQCDLVRVEGLTMIRLMVVLLMSYSRAVSVVFSSLGSWSYSKKCVHCLRKKVC